MIHKMEKEVCKDLIIELRSHQNIIGAKGEKIREIREKFNQINITFSELGVKSDKVTIRGPKSDVDACYKYLHRMNEEMKFTNFSVEVPIYNQNHKFIIRKGEANIKKIRDETNTKIDLPARLGRI
ncbi:vigilin [Nephila pilipes]|uniref:Vigilin n=1 Tax=Nephila pilipes TaxID=299642 RepID=A0A8X6TFK4_NEPPI|nr:vigilin [Nephila pilipes]